MFRPVLLVKTETSISEEGREMEGGRLHEMAMKKKRTRISSTRTCALTNQKRVVKTNNHNKP